MAKSSRSNIGNNQNQDLTDQLNSPEDFTRALLDGLHDQVLMVDRQYRIRIVNQAFLDDVKLMQEQVLGKTCYQVCFDLNDPCTGEKWSCPIREVWKNGQTARSVYPYLNQDGTTRWLDVAASPLVDQSGDIEQVILARRDVSAEHVLRDRLSGVHTLGRELFLTRDEGKILQVGIDAAKILSRSHTAKALLLNDDHDKLDVWTLTHGAYVVLSDQIALSDLPRQIRAVLESGEIVYRPKTNDENLISGNLECASMLYVPMLVRDRAIGLLLVGNQKQDVFDRTDRELLNTLAGQMAIAIENTRLHKRAQQEIKVRKQAEEKNEKYAANLELLNDISNQIATILEVEKVLLKVTELANEYFGYRSAAFLALDVEQCQLIVEATAGKLPGAFKDGEEYGIDQTLLEKFVKSEDILLFENAREVSAALSGNDSEEIQLNVFVPVQIDNEIFGFLALEDIQDEGDDCSRLMILETMADHLAIAVQNAKLYQAEKEQRKLVERSRLQLVQSEKLAATGRLTATLAHEINNPLQALHNSLQLLLSFTLDQQEQREYLKIAQENVERLIELVRGMLDFSRKPKPEMEIIKVNQVVERTIKLSKKYIENRGINLEMNLSPDLPPTHGKPGELQQVFLNLVMNAVDAMSNGGRLTISSSLQNQGENKQIVITFSDTGPGIPVEDQDKIFEPFYSTKEQGTGLGLSISYSVIQRHGGQLTYHSRPSKGSTFQVIIPVQ